MTKLASHSVSTFSLATVCVALLLALASPTGASDRGPSQPSQVKSTASTPTNKLRPEDAVPLLPGTSMYSVESASGAAPVPPGGGKIGTLTSVLDPPSPLDSPPPPLSEAQLAAIPRLKQLPQGTATVVAQRTVSNFDGVGMACGTGYLNDHFKDHFVGLPVALFANASRCGTCVDVFCVDTVCSSPLLANKTFMVVDECRECTGASLVMSAPGAAALSGVSVDLNPSIQVAWEPTPCGDLIQGGIRMLPSPNNNPVFLSLNFSNLKALLAGVRVNGLALAPTDHNAWVIDTLGRPIPLRSPYTLQLAAQGGQQLSVRVAALSAQDLGVNFDI